VLLIGRRIWSCVLAGAGDGAVARRLPASADHDAGARGARGRGRTLDARRVRVAVLAYTAPPTSASVGAQRAAQLVAPATQVEWRGDGGLLLPGREWRFSGALQRSHSLSMRQLRSRRAQ
jgi:hypothetical protein